MSEWKASNARLTLFPAVPASFSEISGLALYRSIWGGDPDVFQKPPNNPLMPTVAQGKRGGVSFGCFVHPTRIDFQIGAAPPSPQDAQQISYRLIEDARELQAIISGIVDSIGNNAIGSDVSRVALNLQFLVLVPDFTEANRQLASVIPDEHGLKVRDEEDVIFQVNRPYVSRVAAGQRMNAVTKWSVDRLQVLAFSITGVAPSAGARVDALGKPQTKEFIAADVSFEVNSAPNVSNLPQREQASLLREAFNWVEQRQREIGLNVEGLRDV